MSHPCRKITWIQLCNCRFGNTRIQSYKVNWILAGRISLNFLFHFLWNLHNSLFLCFNVSLESLVKFWHLIFGLAKRMTFLSLKDPTCKFLFHFFVFLLKFFEFLIFKFSLSENEWFSFIELFNVELFLFVSKDIIHILNFFLIFFKLSIKISFSDLIR